MARTAGIASGNNLVFPTSLTDYNGLSSLPPYTCRLAILRGSEAASPTAPTLDVDTATLFMVPLAQYQISTGGTVSALTDRREYCTFATAGTVVKIAETVLGSAAASISFTGIAATYSHLKVEVQARGTLAGRWQINFDAAQ
ncbi:MAG: hypothetical protein R3D55_11870 [Chloroflexota bacterium]